MSQFAKYLLVFGNLISLIIFLIISNEVRRIINSQLFVIGHEYKNLILGWEPKILVIIYFIVILLFAIASFILFAKY